MVASSLDINFRVLNNLDKSKHCITSRAWKLVFGITFLGSTLYS